MIVMRRKWFAVRTGEEALLLGKRAEAAVIRNG